MINQNIKVVIERIFHQVAPEIDFKKIDTTKPLRDQVEIDSYDFFRIIVKIQQETGVYIPDSKIQGFRNLDELINFVSGQPTLHQSQSPGQ